MCEYMCVRVHEQMYLCTDRSQPPYWLLLPIFILWACITKNLSQPATHRPICQLDAAYVHRQIEDVESLQNFLSTHYKEYKVVCMCVCTSLKYNKMHIHTLRMLMAFITWQKIEHPIECLFLGFWLSNFDLVRTDVLHISTWRTAAVGFSLVTKQ